MTTAKEVSDRFWLTLFQAHALWKVLKGVPHFVDFFTWSSHLEVVNVHHKMRDTFRMPIA